jgi:ribosomal protein RSM22 (predicted rRNA methylase)
MRKSLKLPFAPDLEALMRRLIGRYTGGRDVLSDAEVGEVAWGVSSLWEGFTGERQLAGESYLARPELLHAYSLYYLPRSYVQARLAFRHLEANASAIRRVLDLGSGPGPLLLAAQDAFGLARNESSELFAVDHDPKALQLARELTGARTRTAQSELPQLPATLKGQQFDLVSLGLVVNELFKGRPDAVERRASWLREQVWPLVAPGGHLVLIEPALKETGREALQLRDRLVASNLEVVAPCSRQGACPALLKERDWCHAGVRFEPPSALRAIGRSVGIDPSDLRFSYFIFREQRKNAQAMPISPLAERLRVVSELLEEKGRKKLWVCGERGRVLLDRQDKHRSDSNSVMDELVRDDLIEVSGAEEKPESLRVNEQTQVRRVQSAIER